MQLGEDALTLLYAVRRDAVSTPSCSAQNIPPSEPVRATARAQPSRVRASSAAPPYSSSGMCPW
ncbi:hypothetical protein ACFSNO_18295 [Streptomyces cirratus]